jgi:hypothetical protein
VASRFGCSGGGFSRAMVSFRLGPIACVLGGAGQWWHRVAGSMPCRCECGARLGGVQVHGNASPALLVLGGMVASEWHGRGIVHARSKAGMAWGIDHGGRHGAGGEVTAREGVIAVLPKFGIHDGHGCILSEGGVAGWCRYGVGSC